MHENTSVKLSNHINQTDMAGWPQEKLDDALTRAAETGELKRVKTLLEHGADVNARSDYAFRWAVSQGHASVVDLLLSHGADKDAWHGSVWESFSKHENADMKAVFQKWQMRAMPIEIPMTVWQGKTLKELYQIVPEYGENGFVLLAKANMFDHVLGLVKKDNKDRLRMKYLKSVGACGSTVLDILGERDQLSKILRAKFWKHRSGMLRKCYNENVAPAYQKQIDIDKNINRIDYLLKKQRALRLMLSPSKAVRRRPKPK